MARLGPNPERVLFAPLIWRLALRIEQATWSEVATAPAEAVLVLRSAQRLFKQDIHCASFDTWMEAEAAGLAIARDDLGRPASRPPVPAELAAVEDVLKAAPIASAVEVVRRLAQDDGQVVPLATLTGSATLLARLGASRGDYVRQIMLGLARAYCEAGAAALLLLEEEPDRDGAEVSRLSALFNLAEYYATPVFILSRTPVSPQGIAALEKAGACVLAPQIASRGLIPLPPEISSASGWLAMSRWELDPDTDPNDVQAWRQRLLAA
jgi:hypothetical protein